MSDLQLPDRLVQLRGRWEADPASRIFLQLAEEYRHLGRMSEALAVLDAGLQEHPGYLSALVAKGRCLLELGQPGAARDVLERVVRQDATQAVANKLLVRAYVETGQADKAKDRLDLYSLLHDGDPEIGDLRGRIRRLDSQGPVPVAAPETAAAGPGPAVAAIVSPPPSALGEPGGALPERRSEVLVPTPSRGNTQDDVFDLAPPALKRPEAGDLFALAVPEPAPPAPQVQVPAAVTAPASLAGTLPVPPVPPVSIAVPPAETAPETGAADDPFPGLVNPDVRRRYLSAFAAEGLFAALAPAPPVTVAPPSPPAPPPPPPPPPRETPAPAPGEIFPLRSIGEAVEAELRRGAAPPPPSPPPAPPAPAAPAEPEIAAPPAIAALPELPAIEAPAETGEAATVTLGELYLRQGYLAEAERIFGEVLRRDPGSAAAREGLAQIAGERLPPPPPPPAAVAVPALPTGGDARSRKIEVLTSYLQRIRRGSQPHVS